MIQPTTQPMTHLAQWSRQWSRRLAIAAGTLSLAIATALPASADPFRDTSPRQFDPNVEAAFDAMFKAGDYQEANRLLQTASESEPLTHAMQATLAYLSEDWDRLSQEADQTLASATQLLDQDPLRGHLYTAVGHFMQGGYALSTQDVVSATPLVLNKLRLVFDNFNQAEEIDPGDPELNLIRGYMDLLLAVNLPFSSPDEAIDKFSSFGAPAHLVNRGLAIAYRDLDQYDQAIASVDQALQQAPQNPDLLYLKAQILRLQGDLDTSVRLFNQALKQQAQMPTNLANQIAREMCRTRRDLNGEGPNCDNWVRRWREQVNGSEGAEASPTAPQGTAMSSYPSTSHP
ncbi:MAG: Sll0314/Alr1548 family TPR repeat-containing protein [Elainellaceae cyanobacterium]